MCMKYSVWVRIPLYKVCSGLYTLLNELLHVKLCNDKQKLKVISLKEFRYLVRDKQGERLSKVTIK